jgi:uncharacterized membrane protein
MSDAPPAEGSLIARLVRYFFQGLLFLGPIVLTLYVVGLSVLAVDGWLGLPIPGLGLIIEIGLLVGAGFLLSNYFAQRAAATIEGFLDKLPLVKLLHKSTKDFMTALMGDKKRFDRPALVELSPGVRTLGFVTRDPIDVFEAPDFVAVYLPQAYNFAGQLLIVPRTSITPLEAPPSEIMQFIVSGGVSSG